MKIEKFKLNKILLFILLITPLISQAQDQNIQLANNYAFKEEYDKALDIYKRLEKNKKNIPYIHQNYYKVLFTLGKFDIAEKYINKVIRWYPKTIKYTIDKGMIYHNKGQKEKTEKYFSDLITTATKKKNQLSLANELYHKRLYTYSLRSFLEASRAKKNNPSIILQIASLYAITNQKKLMIEEYINYLEINSSGYNYVKNVMQLYLKDEKERNMLREILLEKIQKKPQYLAYREMLTWLEIQEKNFMDAFIQAKSLDRLKKEEGTRTMEVADIAYKNKDYQASLEIYEYLVKAYPNSPLYYNYKNKLIKSREGIVLKNKFPIDKEQINLLIKDYQDLINTSTLPYVVHQSKKDQAYLLAFYLDKYDEAIKILKDLIKYDNPQKNLKAESKLLLADIYILTDEVWESTLLYFQVEKENKATNIGYSARLKNAKLSFYRGDFDWTKEQLNILKVATSREIANDAIDLGLLIKENKEEGKNKLLKSYASIMLLRFQHKKSQALDSLNFYLSKGKYSSLTDDMLSQRAHIYHEQGNDQKAIEDLDRILKEYTNDILADDALFFKGEINENSIKNKEEAMRAYQKLIKDYPGSFYAEEARKRFRQLRGDNI